jgi:cyclopropane-fatty-acyl-phospholipid synthase
MAIEHRRISEMPTAAKQRYEASGLATQSGSLRHERFGLEALFNRLERPSIQMKLWDGFTVGTPDGSIGTVTFNNRSVLYQLLFLGEVAFGDGYSVGSIDIEGNLVDMLVEINANRNNRVGVGAPFEKLPLTRFRPTNTLGRAQENIHHHYDVGNDFYRLWLDDEMQYTCAYFPYPDMTLEAAQQAKMDHVCRKLQLQPGDRVVEAGCGWGGLARHMAKYYGAKVTAYNISKEQVRYASDRARTEGYDDKVSYIEDDYRNINGSFDVFVSVGMLEHVGNENYKILGDVIESSLVKEGRALIHSIGRNAARPMSPWIDRRIFPGAYPPTLREMMNILEPNRFSVLDVENLRLHYARTLEHWLQRFELSNLEVSEMFDERFVRVWRLYLSGSIAAFLTGGLQLFQVVFSRESNNRVPWSREHLY